MAWLTAGLTARVLTDLPADLAGALPVVQIERVGGDDDGIRLDRAFVDVDAYASTRQAASELLSQARSLILSSLRGTVTDAAVFTSVRTITAPARRPYENPSVRRFGATFEIFSHPVVS